MRMRELEIFTYERGKLLILNFVGLNSANYSKLFAVYV